MSPDPKKPKLQKKLIINAFNPGSAQRWRVDHDQSSRFTNDVDAWIEYAQKAEEGKLHAIFVADHLVAFDEFEGPHNFKHPAKAGLSFPRIDPSSWVPAAAANTQSIGFGITFSTVSEHPYLFHRRIASLDHVTKGRIGWNIVSSYLNSIGRNLLNGEPFPEHDERYVKTEEYLDVVYGLLLSSWRDDALVKDVENATFVNPDAVREINHEGKYFKVAGPAIVEPSRQRFPLIIQAGTSKKGKELGAANAEVVYLDDRDKPHLKEKIEAIKTIAVEKFGRSRDSIKFLIASIPIIGKTHEDAERKLKELTEAGIPLSAEIGFSGISGIDLSKFELDDEVPIGPANNNLRTTVEGITRQKKPGKALTKREIIENYRARSGSLFGSYIEVADEIERWVRDYDIDGLNLGSHTFPQGINDIVDLLIPELQKRGLFHLDYEVPGGTLRENLNGEKGKTFLSEDHPAYGLRWEAGVSQEDFEKKLSEIKKKTKEIRESL
ncbi:putative monooxygenase [Wickerhamomyces ciferrii]|uniref:Monooxygenase n=1 Tax=Wickerhamomyces ciferrii (strain ATCC 14091 / BCRC 22168 / CBS 111 / JCM 3599 / NBRC 0793 / NRRL Y-1031 F-60-10) TaxID=1206466 RepID=K0KK53_WICCF|nr:putative monooxygenase [Wickerhamomyces ciferrii]CCH45620.1 putative monooxygenase [Wickerhamomyces ciferrii]